MAADAVDYSIVIPVFYNEGSLETVEAELRAKVIEALPRYKGEILFVDDGSGDKSYEVLQTIRERHKNDVRVIKLSRNFGQVNAVWCGFSHAPSAVIMFSADGQDPVDLIPEMLEKHFDQGYEVVIAKRTSREDGIIRSLTSSIVYWLMRKMTNDDMPIGGFDFLLLGNRAKTALLQSYQPHTFFQARILDLGFSRTWINYNRKNRLHGKSKWTLAKKITYMIDGVLGHSFLPIRIISCVGCLFSITSFLLAMFFLINYLINGHKLPGWTPIILSVLFVGGMQMLMIGIIGEYLWRVLAQVRNNTPFIIEKIDDK
jgi:glycosyltransferase involved in cell wall biosynthesis